MMTIFYFFMKICEMYFFKDSLSPPNLVEKRNVDKLHQPKRKMRQDYLFFIYLKTMF